MDLLEADRQAMAMLPPMDPLVGLTGRIRLARDYYVRVDGNDYSVNPRMIGRFVDGIATPALVAVTCAEQFVATHERVWASHGVDPDPTTSPPLPAACAAEFAAPGASPADPRPAHSDGHVVASAPCRTTTRSTAWSSTPPRPPPSPHAAAAAEASNP